MNIQPPVIEHMVEALAAGRTKRYHTRAMHDYQTVAAHSWGVAMLVLAIAESPSVDLLKAALVHDLGEAKTGDVPATAKWDSGELAYLLDQMERYELMRMHLHVNLTVHDRRILKLADILELMNHVTDEMLMGNAHAKDMLINALDYSKKCLENHDDISEDELDNYLVLKSHIYCKVNMP